MKDYLVRGMSMDGFVKVVAIRSTELVRRGAEIQKTTPNATAAFGRALTAASMMGNMQKVENGSMTLQIRGLYFCPAGRCRPPLHACWPPRAALWKTAARWELSCVRR